MSNSNSLSWPEVLRWMLASALAGIQIDGSSCGFLVSCHGSGVSVWHGAVESFHFRSLDHAYRAYRLLWALPLGASVEDVCVALSRSSLSEPPCSSVISWRCALGWTRQGVFLGAYDFPAFGGAHLLLLALLRDGMWTDSLPPYVCCYGLPG